MIDWSKQCCGLHQAPFQQIKILMPNLMPLFQSFPDDPILFTWDIKVHMLMPRQFPCIPNWHVDFVPRLNGIQRFEMIKPEYPIYLWISGPPLTQFKHGYLQAEKWHRFTQRDEHRGTASDSFTWRGMIRGVHREIQQPKDSDWLRRHSQVYLNAETFQW